MRSSFPGSRFHRLRSKPHAPAPLGVGERRDFRRFDLASSAPENIGVGNWYAARLQVFVDGGFVKHDLILFHAVRHGHDVHIAKLRSAFAPISMC